MCNHSGNYLHTASTETGQQLVYNPKFQRRFNAAWTEKQSLANKFTDFFEKKGKKGSHEAMQ